MGQMIGLLLLLIIVGTFADRLTGATGPRGYVPYESATSPTGYAVTRKFYDIQTGDTYYATSPVVYLASTNTRAPRGTINYGYDVPPMGIQPRSY